MNRWERMKKILQRKRRTLNAYRKFFSTEDGQIVLHDLMNTVGMRDTSFVCGKTSSEDVAFKEGQKALVLRILKTVNANEEQIQKHLEVLQKQEEELNE